ncbi:MAG: starch-binding protein [Bacteroidales bacterium]|nr:starch-binding protein [Bacteroidales bacterium]
MLLFISAISVGWGTNYIHWGESGIGGWSDAELSGSGSTETTTITLTAEKNYEFVLKKGDNTWWKFNGTVEVKSGTGYSLSTSNGQNGKISNATGGTYTFTVKWDNNGNPTLTVTFPASSSTYTPVLENANEISCFYEVNSKDYSYIYAWTESGSNKTEYAGDWPGTQMKKVGTTADGKAIYKWTYSGSTAPAKVIFSVGNSSNQTSNLDFTNHGYYVDGAYNRTITAVAETKYSVNISAGEGGTVSPTGDQQVGSTAVDIKAEANTGYTFSNWTTTGGVSVTDANAASTTITATAAGSVKANFTSTSSDAYYLPNSGNNNFERNDNCKFVDGTLTLNLTAGFTFKVCKKTGSSETWYGDGSTISATTTDKSITLNTGNMTLTVTQPGTYTFKVEEISNGVNLSVTYPTSTHTVNVTAGEGGTVTPNGDRTVGTEAVSITATAKGGYVFEKWTASSTGIKIADAYKASTTFTATASGTVTANFTATSSDPIYYVVFPDANVGNTARADKTAPNIPTGHTAFRLIPSRNRNAVTLDKDLVSINLKIDGNKGRQLRYDTDGEIKFYIIDNNGNYFKNTNFNGSNDYLHAFKTGQLGNTANNGVDCYDTRDGSITSTTAPGYYYTIHEDDAKDTKSLTFMFSKNNSQDKSYIINSGDEHPTTYKQPSNSVDGFDSGIKSGNLIVGFLTSRGYNSAYYTNHISNGVYLVGQMDGKKYTFDKNYKMKQILYPLGTTEAAADSIVYSYTVKKGEANWNDFFLSFSTGDKIDDGKLWNLLLRPSVQNQMDGQALEGGVTFFKNDNGTDNTQQALNPLLSNEQKQRYVSYTIYFNATYSTYRIEFHDGFYIAGEAVEESGSYDPANRIAMSKADLNGVEHYIYTGKFFQGKKFAFFLNENTYTLNYCEDNNAVTYDEKTSPTAWDVQAPANGADYAFYNRVQYNITGSDGSLGVGKSDLVWGLPTGTYTIRFYNHAEKENNNQLYTVDKEVLMANATSSYKNNVNDENETEHNNGGWRTFSDDCALLLPNGVKAYYAANVGNGKVYLKELTDGYIPAHCPVIISNPNLLAGNKSIAFPVRPEGYDVKLADGETNYLVDCYDKSGTVSPEVTNEEGKTKYNYFFAHLYKFNGSKVMSGVPLGFWKTFNNAATKKNYTYLSVDTQLYPSKYEQNTFTYDENETVESTKAYCFRMVFDEDELGDNTTTGIEQVKENAEVDMTNAVWHNMQGVRITKPSAPGMYICNGKKVVVR